MPHCAMSNGGSAAFARPAVAAVLAVLVGCAEPPAPRELAAGSFTGIRFLNAPPAAGFGRAMEPRAFAFPGDHGAHDGYGTEWWYFTGNLTGDRGNPFGFELTFFKIGLPGADATRESRWATDTIWMAHFALTDVGAGRFIADERLSRGALGLAGATLEPYRVWVEDWSAAGDFRTGAGTVRLSAASADAAIDLELTGFERIVLQGEQGLDRKGPEIGNASYYYSAPRLAVTGTIRSADAAEGVTGFAWMDREWGTSALSPGVRGWDWFALRLDDGRDLMFYRLRHADDSASPFSGGTLTDVAGISRRLNLADVELESTEVWQSPASGVTYPVAWRMRVPDTDLELSITPALRDQELRLSVRYWEGAIDIVGRSAGVEIRGRGYLELAGY